MSTLTPGALPLLLFFAVLLAYTAGVARSKAPWSVWRSASFFCGTTCVLVALSHPVDSFAHHDFRGHMIQHLLLGMFAPLGLVLGAPLTLALRALSAGASRRIVWVIRSKPFHWLSHPVTALMLNTGGMCLLYLTSLYAFTFTRSYLHHLAHFHFFAAGYLFTWAIVGPDPVPGRPSMRLRLIVLFVSIAVHANLSKLMYAYLLPSHTPYSVDEIRAGAQLMYYGGDLAELLLLVAFFAMWYGRRRREMVASPAANMNSIARYR